MSMTTTTGFVLVLSDDEIRSQRSEVCSRDEMFARAARSAFRGHKCTHARVVLGSCS